MPVYPPESTIESVEINADEYDDIRDKIGQRSAEFRTLKYDNGVVLGPAPTNVVRIDIDKAILKAGETSVISFELLGPGSLSVRVGNQTLIINEAVRERTLTTKVT